MASILKVDEMQGVTSAGDITITGEGGSATMQLQQGLAKVLSRVDTYTPGNSPSVNVSGSTDNGTGDMTLNFTNSFSGANEQFPAVFNGSSNFICNQVTRATAATTALPSGSIRVELRSDAGSHGDSYHGSISIHGDLA